MKRSSSNRPDHGSSPQRLGYRMPAEWSRHQATWLSWPHNLETWWDGMEPIHAFYAKLVTAIAEHEPVHMNVANDEMESLARSVLSKAPLDQVTFHHFPTNDAWIRDHGAVMVSCVQEEGLYPPLIAIDWGYNAWGGKYPPFDLDNAIPMCMARALAIPCVGGGMILEGGSVEVNGCGDLLTTEECLLNANRNPELSQDQIEAKLKMLLGVERIHWLTATIQGDDTDSHIDNLARFVNPTTIVVAVEDDERSVNYDSLQSNYERVCSLQLNGDVLPEVIKLPMPDPVVDRNTNRLPASYANFYITNGSVIVPQFGQDKDQAVVDTLSDLFPDRTITGINCCDLLVGLGAIHCLTQQVPA